jgi:integrase
MTMGRIFKRGGVHWIAYYHRGKEFRESTHSHREVDAKRLLTKRIGEIQGGKFVAPAQDRVPFAMLLDNLLINYRNNGRRSVGKVQSHLKAIRRAFGFDRAIDITESAIERYKASRLGEKKAPATVNRELALIRRAFRLGVKHKLIAMMPSIELLAEHNARQGFFEHSDLEAVIRHLPADLRDFTRFAYLSGWRKGEIVSLKWRDVDRDARVIRLRPEASKTGEPGTLALEEELWDLIERRRAAREHKTAEGQTVIHRDLGHEAGELALQSPSSTA